ncbi:MAG: PSD1 and planctomycete cytochrome C domain-containing protein [Bryobacteraceae bacterium]
MRVSIPGVLAALFSALGLLAAEGSQFERDIRPILEKHCAGCHSGKSPQASLDVRSRASLIAGGISGAAVVPGSAEQSLLYRRLLAGQMPPVAPLPREYVILLRDWIEAGARAENPDAPAKTDGHQHWAFRTPVRPPLPEVSAKQRVRTPVDALVLAELEERGLSLSADASPETLIRRVTYDLTGLPPSPQQVDRFLADRTADAYERYVDELLASPRYGERWARHWLDAAGYTDSEGVLAADVIRPNAWRYRDYVIRAFNTDKPYDRFLLEQLAGDELSDYRKHDKLPPDVVEALEATGFLRTAVDATREDFLPKDFAEYQWRTLFDTGQIFSSALMGLTLQCARCHDHKYEPLTQKDYYRLQAFFAGAIRPEGTVLPTYKRVIVEATMAEQKVAEKVNGPLDLLVKALNDLKRARLAQYRAKHPNGDSATERELREAFPDYAAKVDAIGRELREEEARRIHLPTIRALYDLDANPPPTSVLLRGDPKNPGEEVSPGVPAVLDDPSRPWQMPEPAAGGSTTGRRKALADWLTRPDHPLTARVMVNRIWAGHFGSGIVPSVDNFGRSGTPPVNQPLLDWLATEFVRQGWSIKAMHRLIVTSSVYRQSSVARPDGLRIDPENRLLWRVPPRRLEAEIVRDAILEAAGRLDKTMYGEPVMTRTRESGEIVPVDDECGGRRSIYQLVRRSLPQSILAAFDAPVMEINCPRRTTSTSATQALALMNSTFITAQAGHFANRILRERPPAGEASGRKTVEHAFRIALGRGPSPVEMDAMLGFLERQKHHYADEATNIVQWRIYSDLCQALFGANEFLYID